ncbi:MAG: PEP-CTERM sorting domain-containing protein [bacterium]|nr:PEP-CTERM sorting domain-containing protein [bacterium]
MITTGMDYWEDDGVTYSVVKNSVGAGVEDIGLYDTNTTTGELTLLRDLSTETAVRGSTAIAVIPEPATGILLAFAGLALLRRR